MEFETNPIVENLLVLGAGASKEYGLPVWQELDGLIRKTLDADTVGIYQFKNEIRNWLDNVGIGKKYKTIDECIKHASVLPEHKSNGELVEDQIFRIIKDVFREAYRDNDEGWVRALNQKLLYSQESLEQKIAFVNYNYDYVLEKNLLHYEYLPSKASRLIHRNRLRSLLPITFDVFYPHGNVFSVSETQPSHVKRHSRTMKSADKELIDAVSCHESFEHAVRNPYPLGEIRLYLLGLGGGMEVNLNNLRFENEISEVHVTIFDEKLKDSVVSFLGEKYKKHPEEIVVYKTCGELIEKCF